jgi:hypothetical protein
MLEQLDVQIRSSRVAHDVGQLERRGSSAK